MVFLVGPKGLVNKFVGDLVSLFFTNYFQPFNVASAC